MPVLLYKLYGARSILNTIIQSLSPHNSMLNMSLVKHSVTKSSVLLCFESYFNVANSDTAEQAYMSVEKSK